MSNGKENDTAGMNTERNRSAKASDVLRLSKGYKQTKLGWIPENWKVATLGDLGEFKNGINKGKEDFGFGVPFINLMDVFGKPVLVKSDWELVNANISEVENYNLKKGDVLFIRSSVKRSGVGLTSIIKEDFPNTVYSGFLIRYRLEDAFTFDNDFLQYCFNEKNFRKRLIVKSSSSANTNINQYNLKKLIVALPPIPEQQKIARVLNTWDTAIAAQKKLIAQKQALKNGLMQQLLTGKKRFDGFEEEWEEVRLSEITTLITKGTTPTSLGYKFTTEGVNFIKAESISKFGFIDILNTPKISSECNLVLQRSILRKNDIVFSIAGTLGRTAIVKEKDLPANTNQALSIIRLKKDTNVEFINFCLNTNSIDKYILGMVSVGAQPNINLQQVGNIKINLPSKEEQIVIVKALKYAELELFIIKRKLQSLKNQKQGLMQQLLTGEKRVKI